MYDIYLVERNTKIVKISVRSYLLNYKQFKYVLNERRIETTM